MSLASEVVEASMIGAKQLLKATSIEFFKNVFNYTPNMRTLFNNSMVLNSKRYNLEDHIKFPQGSRLMKRKLEIEHWIRRVKEVVDEVVENE